MPSDFPIDLYEAVHIRVNKKKTIYPDTWSQYAGAWNAVAYRFLACADYDQAFTESIQRAGNAPPPTERYNQERALFGFFVTGLSVIESLCYGSFAVASMIDVQNFPMTTPQNLKDINPEYTTKKFISVFPTDPITILLKQLTTSQDYRDWKDIRNILAHRSAPGRTIQFSINPGSQIDGALWINGINIDINMTSSKRQWLSTILRKLLEETNSFTTGRL